MSGVHLMIYKDMARELTTKMKNAENVDPSGLMPNRIKSAGVNMVKDLINQIIVEGVVSVELELGTIVHCYLRKVNTVRRGNYRGLKLTGQVPKIVERIITKLIRQCLI